MSLRLLQLSDCHLQSNPADSYRGIDPELNLQRILHSALEWQPDAMVLSGDLADHATTGTYQRLNDYIAELKVPVMAFPGNHDDFALMQTALTDSVFTWHNPWVVGGWQLVWLDSNLAEKPEGELDAKKLAVLDDIDPELPTLLFLHHQPIEVGTPWIDRFKLKNPELLWQWLSTHTHNIQAIGWGHIHHGWINDKMINDRLIQLLGAPSTSACAMPGCTEFELDLRGPRMRWFNLLDSGQLQTGLLSVA